MTRAGAGLPPLRELAAARGIHIGAATERQFESDAGYAGILAREFNMVTPENDLKMARLQPERGRFSFEAADAIVGFARAHGMAVRGHTLVWHTMLPSWLEEAISTSDGAISILREHIRAVLAHYDGVIIPWDVVNEAFDERGDWRDTPFLRAFGPDYLALAFKWAHEASPRARLYYNDYEIETINPKSDAVYRTVAALVKQGVPIHGIGLQGHVLLAAPPDYDSVAENIRRFNRLGLDVQFTEVDVRIPEPVTPAALARQAAIYTGLLRTCLKASQCSAFIVWGVTDLHSWIPAFFKGHGAGLLFDEAGAPKPAYEAVARTLAGKGHAGGSFLRRAWREIRGRSRHTQP